MALIAAVFLKLTGPKNVVDKCLKCRVSEDPSTDKMANRLKSYCNLKNCTFNMFINHFEGNCVGKSLF